MVFIMPARDFIFDRFPTNRRDVGIGSSPVRGESLIAAQVRYAMAYAHNLLVNRDTPPSAKNPIVLEDVDSTETRFLWTACMVFGMHHPTIKFGSEAIVIQSHKIVENTFNPKNEKGYFSTFCSASLYETEFKHRWTQEMLSTPDFFNPIISNSRFYSWKTGQHQRASKICTVDFEGYSRNKSATVEKFKALFSSIPQEEPVRLVLFTDMFDGIDKRKDFEEIFSHLPNQVIQLHGYGEDKKLRKIHLAMPARIEIFLSISDYTHAEQMRWVTSLPSDLKSLFLDESYLGGKSLPEMLQLLKTLPNLQALSLCYNNLFVFGANLKEILAALPSSVVELDLSGNGLESSEETLIEKSLPRNIEICYLNDEQRPIGRKAASRIQDEKIKAEKDALKAEESHDSFPKENAERVRYAMAWASRFFAGHPGIIPSKDNYIKIMFQNAEEEKYIWTAFMAFGMSTPHLRFKSNALQPRNFGFLPWLELEPNFLWWGEKFSKTSLYETVFKKYLTKEMFIISDNAAFYEGISGKLSMKEQQELYRKSQNSKTQTRQPDIVSSPQQKATKKPRAQQKKSMQQVQEVNKQENNKVKEQSHLNTESTPSLLSRVSASQTFDESQAESNPILEEAQAYETGSAERKKDLNRAFSLYLSAAKRGHPVALSSLERLGDVMDIQQQNELGQLYRFFNMNHKAQYWQEKANDAVLSKT